MGTAARYRWVIVFFTVFVSACERPPASSFVYPEDAPHACAALPHARDDTTFRTQAGIEVLVRAPTNYRPNIAHPLIVVFAGAGMSPRATERLTAFTQPATARGYIVAYPQHIRPSKRALEKLAAVAGEAMQRFCVDRERVFYTGHSDGGTTTTALAILHSADVAAIAPSAAGFTRQDLDEMTCPAPRPVMIWHGKRDQLFPGWGREAAGWWAECNACAHEPPIEGEPCQTFSGCRAPVTYCEMDIGHTIWPPLATARMLTLFDKSRPTTDQ